VYFVEPILFLNFETMTRIAWAATMWFAGMVSLFGQNVTTKGREFWLAFMENNDTLFSYIENGEVINERLSVYVSSEIATSGTISIPLIGWSQNFTVAAGSTTEIPIPQPNQRAHTVGSNVVRATGVRVVAQDSVNVFAINYQKNTADATIVLPVGALRNDYWIMAYKESNVSQFCVVAVEDNTVVTVLPPPNIFISGYAGNFPYTVTLQRGQVFQAQSNGDLTGTRVYTPPGAHCKPFAVFAGNRCTNVGGAPRCDHLYEQMFPTATLGKTYLSIPFRTRDADLVRVLAVENQTLVHASGQSPFTLNAGQYQDFTLSNATYFVADKPVLLAQLSRSACTDAANQIPCANSSENVYADPFMLMLTSMEQMIIRRATVNSFVIPNITRRFLNIATKTVNTGVLRLDGMPVSGFQAVPGTPFSYVQVEVAQGNHTVASDSGFVLYVYGFGERDSYGYSGDAVLNNFSIRIQGPEKACVQQNVSFSVTLQGLNATGFDWNFGDGTQATGANVSHAYGQAGTYYVKLRLTTGDGCGADSTVRQIDVFSPSLEITALDSAGCGGLANGRVTVRGLGGPSPFAFSLDGGPWIQDDDNARTFTGLAAGEHVIRFRDAAGCEGAFAFVMPERVQINLSITDMQHVLCHGEATGRFRLVATGASPPFTVGLNDGPFGAQTTFTGLAAGTYVLRVRDANGCELVRNVVLSQPDAPLHIAVSELTHPACHGETTGRFLLSATGGTPPFAWFVNGAPTSAGWVSGLAAGSYAILLRDANGCLTRDTVIVVQPPPPEAELQIVQVRCTGVSDGRIVVHPGGGVPPYTFALDDTSNFGSSPVFSDLAVGTYRVYIRDANGCRLDLYAVLDTVSIFTVSVVSTTAASCFNVSDGVATLSVAGGGAPPFEFSRDGINFQSSPTITGLPPGSGTVVVRDAQGCLAYRPIFISSPPALYFSELVVKHPSCFEYSDGSIAPTALGGTGNIDYFIEGGDGFYDLPAGNYLIRARDATGCRIDTTITLAHPAALSASGQIRNVSCHGIGDGSVAVHAAGGTSPYLFSMDGNFFQNDSTFTGLSPGNYTIDVRDANGCSFSFHATVVQPDSLFAASIVLSNVPCYGGSDGKVEIVATGGVPPYSFSHGTGFDAQNPRQNLTAGVYTFTVRDANGCEFSLTDTVSQPPALEFTGISVRHASCFDARDGKITVAGAVGGTGEWTFSLNGGEFSTAREFTGLSAGEYVLAVRDENGCIRDTVLEISRPAPLELSFELQHVSCFGGRDGKIFSSATGTGPLVYRLNEGPYRSSGIFTDLAAGQYTLTVRDATGCERAFSLTVAQPEALKAELTQKTNVLCKSTPGGAARIRVTGGTQPYAYRWSHRTWDGSEAEGLYAGDYRVVVTDARGCQDTLVFTIEEPEFAVEAGDHLFACYLLGETSGRMEQLGPFRPSGGRWRGPAVDESTGRISVAAAPKNERFFAYYTYNGCTDSVLVQIAVVDAGGEEAFCENDGVVTLRGGTPAGGVWEGPGITEAARGRFNTAALPFGVHRVYYRYDATCAAEKMIIVHPAPRADFSSQPSSEKPLYLPEARVDLRFTGTGAEKYRWDFGDGSPPSFDKNTFHVFNAEGEYRVKLTAMNDAFCEDTAVKTFRVRVRPYLQEFPNAFSPNYDPVNPRWEVNVKACRSFDFMIFDRWGREVYSVTGGTPTEKLSWDGMLRDGTPVPEGVYTYVFRGVFTDDSEVERHGTITVIR
jgi:gliding motility-associated-like protein